MFTPSANTQANRNGPPRRPFLAGLWPTSGACALVLCSATLLADEAPSASSDPKPVSITDAERSDELEAEKAKLETQLEQAREATDDTRDQVSSLRARLEDLEREKTALRTQLDELDRKHAELQERAARVAPLERQLNASQTAAERAEARAEALREEIEQLKQQRDSAAQEHSAQLTAAELRLREHKDRLGGVEARIQHLEQQLAQREAHIERLRTADERHTEAKQRLETRLDELRARLPVPEGGTVTAEQVRDQAQQQAETLERLIRGGQGINNPQLRARIRAAEHELHDSQSLLARTQGSRTVYRVRPGDTIGRISAIVYGEAQGWQRIFEANRHLLDDPDQVLPGFTLVIP